MIAGDGRDMKEFDVCYAGNGSGPGMKARAPVSIVQGDLAAGTTLRDLRIVLWDQPAYETFREVWEAMNA
jgi:hypothetical protein